MENVIAWQTSAENSDISLFRPHFCSEPNQKFGRGPESQKEILMGGVHLANWLKQTEINKLWNHIQTMQKVDHAM